MQQDNATKPNIRTLKKYIKFQYNERKLIHAPITHFYYIQQKLACVEVVHLSKGNREKKLKSLEAKTFESLRASENSNKWLKNKGDTLRP